jgi:hypothetical protein
MTTIIHAPSCVLCRNPVGPDGKVVRARGQVVAHICARDAELLVVGASVARRYGGAFLRGFLRQRYPDGFKAAQKLYLAIAAGRAEASAVGVAT